MFSEHIEKNVCEKTRKKPKEQIVPAKWETAMILQSSCTHMICFLLLRSQNTWTRTKLKCELFDENVFLFLSSKHSNGISEPFSSEANADSRYDSCISNATHLSTLTYRYIYRSRVFFCSKCKTHVSDTIQLMGDNNRDFLCIQFRAFREQEKKKRDSKQSIRATSQRHLTDERWMQLCPC